MEIASLREGGGPLAVEGESVMKKRIRLALWESCRGATERAGRGRRLRRPVSLPCVKGGVV